MLHLASTHMPIHTRTESNHIYPYWGVLAYISNTAYPLHSAYIIHIHIPYLSQMKTLIIHAITYTIIKFANYYEDEWLTISTRVYHGVTHAIKRKGTIIKQLHVCVTGVNTCNTYKISIQLRHNMCHLTHISIASLDWDVPWIYRSTSKRLGKEHTCIGTLWPGI
jgi:hypothetical protein